ANADAGLNIRGVGAAGNSIWGNYIGIERSGRFEQGNAKNGIAIWQGATSNTIGGTTSGYRNVITGNRHNGVWISGPGTNQNVVIGNYIGTTSNGVEKIGNGYAGVAVQGGASNT